MSENSIFIIDDSGKEVEMKILLTFGANEKNYVVVYDPQDEDTLYSFIYDLDGNLFQVDDPDELDMIQEVIDAYDQEEEK